MPKFNLKPYRTAYEALITPFTAAKMCSLLGNSAANLNDPFLRNVLLNYIESVQSEGSLQNRDVKKPERNIFYLYGFDADLKKLKGIRLYIELLLDADEDADRFEIVSFFNEIESNNQGVLNSDNDDTFTWGGFYVVFNYPDEDVYIEVYNRIGQRTAIVRFENKHVDRWDPSIEMSSGLEDDFHLVNVFIHTHFIPFVRDTNRDIFPDGLIHYDDQNDLDGYGVVE